jgi:hypothetical protein
MSRRTAFQIALVLLLVFSFSTAYGQSQIQPKANLSVFDANGQRVAPVYDTTSSLLIGGEPVIAIEVDRVLLVLTVLKTHFIGRQSGLAFETSDCSGTPFMETGPVTEALGYPLIPGNVVWNNRAYVLQPGELARTITLGSVVWVEPDSAECLPQEPYEITLAPAYQLIDLNQYYVPPFVLK